MVILYLFISAHLREVRARFAVRASASRGARGQATAEYALVLLAAAAIALAVVAWAAKSGKITELFDAVVDQLVGKAG